jgi:hypothetical protein
MNRQHIVRTQVSALRIEVLAPTAARFGALAKLHPDEAKFGSQAVDGGSRPTDSTSSVERAALRPDPIQRRLQSIASDITLACEALERVSRDMRWLEAPDGPVERENQVPMCVGTCGLTAPKPRSHGGLGPLCEACYKSFARYRASTPHGTVAQWQAQRGAA